MLERTSILERYAGIRVLVLGASGFIGRWVARLLTQAQADLWLTTRDLMAARPIFDAYQIAGRTMRIDLADRTAVASVLRQVQPAVVFNLAGYGVDRSERDEGLAYRINAGLVEDLCSGLQEATLSEWPGERLIHAGSALEYGPIGGNLAEDSAPAPDTLYGCSKLAGTDALVSISRKTGLQAVTARLFTVYGPGEHEGRLLPTLLDTARTGQTAQLSHGMQQRDFTYVEDVAEGLLRLGLTHGEPGEIVNLATGRLTSVRDFVETAAQVLDLPPDRLRFGALPTRREEMQHEPVTLVRLSNRTSWRPATTIAEGILRTVHFQTLDCATKQ